MTHTEIFDNSLACIKTAGFMESLKDTAGSAFDASKNMVSEQVNKFKGFQPFNPDNKWSGAGYGALGGALLGAGTAGIGRLLGGGDGPNSSMLSTLLKGGLMGAGVGGGLGYAASKFGPNIGGYLGAKQLRQTSGIDNVSDTNIPGGAGTKSSITDVIDKLGYGAGSNLIQEMNMRDIAGSIGGGKIDYTELGRRRMDKKLGDAMTNFNQ